MNKETTVNTTITFATRIGPGFWTTPTFEAMRFPAGEAHIKVANENEGKGDLTEVCRVYGGSADDLFTVAMWADAAHRRGARTVLQMPYLPGARADHADFVPFGTGVYASFLNSLDVDQLICFDPHSHVMPGLVRQVTVVDPARIVRQHIVGRADQDTHAQRYAGIIAPDKGAIERAARVAAACHLPLYRAEKHRDPDTGKLSGFTCETLPDEGRFLVVDDICDGGGTFVGLAKSTGLPPERLGLYVSHGVFSGYAHESLGYYFGEVWTTDSFRTAEQYDADAKNGTGVFCTIIPLAPTLNGEIQ